jgi:hypothetical protein
MKTLLLFVFFISIVILPSCTKEYTCICYNTLNNTSKLVQMSARNENTARNRCIAKMDSENNVQGNNCDIDK